MDKTIYLNWLNENIKLQLNIGEAMVSVPGKGSMWIPDKPNEPGTPRVNPGIAARDPDLATKVQSAIDRSAKRTGEIPLEKEGEKPDKAKFNPRAIKPKDDVKVGEKKKKSKPGPETSEETPEKNKPLGTLGRASKTRFVDPTTKGSGSTQVSKTGQAHAPGESRQTIRPTGPTRVRESFNFTVNEIIKKD